MTVYRHSMIFRTVFRLVVLRLLDGPAGAALYLGGKMNKDYLAMMDEGELEAYAKVLGFTTAAVVLAQAFVSMPFFVELTKQCAQWRLHRSVRESLCWRREFSSIDFQ